MKDIIDDAAENRPRSAHDAALTPTVFHEDWWLDAATGGNYQMIQVSNGGKVVGRLPCYLSRRFGMKKVGMPTLTHFYGPAVHEGNGNLHTRFANRLEITRELIRQLPDAHFLQVRCHRGVRDVIPFQEQKFRTSVQFTYEIYPASKETLWKKIYHKKRRVISRTLESRTVGLMEDPDAFLRFYMDNLGARGITNNIDMDACRRIILASMARQRASVFTVLDEKKNPTAAIFCVEDNDVLYNLLATRTPTSGSGDISALIWQAMQHASARGLVFDLGGLATGGSAFFYSGFGGEVEPRFVATKMILPLYLARGLLRSSKQDQWYA